MIHHNLDSVAQCNINMEYVHYTYLYEHLSRCKTKSREKNHLQSRNELVGKILAQKKKVEIAPLP